MRRGPRKSPYRSAVVALRNGIAARLKLNAADKSLVAELLARAESGGAVLGTVQGHVPRVPPKKRRRRRHKLRPAIVRKAKRRAAAKVAAVVAPEPAPVAAKAKVRDAEAYASELKAIDEIVVALAKAGKALDKATRAKDGVGIAAASEEIHQLRRRGNDLLVRLGGKAQLPIDKTERMRWKRAAGQPEAKARRTKKLRRPTPPIPPPVVKRTDWHPDENGTMSREIITS